jgi:predicted phage tail protein
MYQVAAFNGAGDNVSTPPTGPVPLPAIPAAPTSLTVSVVKATGNNYTATLNWNEAVDPANFTIQRATNASFTTNLATFTAAGTLRTLTQTVNRNTTYYYRIRANNSLGGSSAWTNALPFPIRTGP